MSKSTKYETELGPQVCPFCGTTREEREFQAKMVNEERRICHDLWKRRSNPKEPVPGLPLTIEGRVHYVLLEYREHSPEELGLPIAELSIPTIRRFAARAGVDAFAIAKALDYIHKTPAALHYWKSQNK